MSEPIAVGTPVTFPRAGKDGIMIADVGGNIFVYVERPGDSQLYQREVWALRRAEVDTTDHMRDWGGQMLSEDEVIAYVARAREFLITHPKRHCSLSYGECPRDAGTALTGPALREALATAQAVTDAHARILEITGLRMQLPGWKDAILQELKALATRPSQPRRGDLVEAWIKRARDQYPDEHDSATTPWQALDDLLDDYRLHADTGTDLSAQAEAGTSYNLDNAIYPG